MLQAGRGGGGVSGESGEELVDCSLQISCSSLFHLCGEPSVEYSLQPVGVISHEYPVRPRWQKDVNILFGVPTIDSVPDPSYRGRWQVSKNNDALPQRASDSQSPSRWVER